LDASAGAAVDLNGDKSLDYLVAGSGDSTVAWYEATSTPEMYRRNEVSTTVDGAAALAVADLNGDRHKDVVVISSYDHTLTVLLNKGNGQFDVRIVSRGVILASALAIADLNGDEHDDLITGTIDGKIWWWENDGTGLFIQHVVCDDDRAMGVASIATADLNDDGTEDVIVAAADKDRVVWFANGRDATGATGKFHDTFGMHIIATDLRIPVSVATADINEDGKPDVIVASAHPHEGEVVLFVNNGEEKDFTRFTVEAEAPGAYALLAVDIDKDGDPDVVVGSVDGKIRWHENRGGTLSKEHPIAAAIEVKEEL